MVKEAARHAWNDAMNKVRVEGGTDEQYRTFYSCLYRSLLFPRKFYEIDKSGSIVHYSPYNGEIKNGYMYTDTGFWDTFRALFPFLNLMYPSVSKEVQESLVNAYKESGFLPEWASPGHRHCMVGNNSASVVADAYLKGCQTKDINLCMRPFYMEQTMYTLKSLQPADQDMNITIVWVIYHTMSVSMKMQPALWNTLMMIGVS